MKKPKQLREVDVSEVGPDHTLNLVFKYTNSQTIVTLDIQEAASVSALITSKILNFIVNGPAVVKPRIN